MGPHSSPATSKSPGRPLLEDSHTQGWCGYCEVCTPRSPCWAAGQRLGKGGSPPSWAHLAAPHPASLPQGAPDCETPCRVGAVRSRNGRRNVGGKDSVAEAARGWWGAPPGGAQGFGPTPTLPQAHLPSCSGRRPVPTLSLWPHPRWAGRGSQTYTPSKQGQQPHPLQSLLKSPPPCVHGARQGGRGSYLNQEGLQGGGIRHHQGQGPQGERPRGGSSRLRSDV